MTGDRPEKPCSDCVNGHCTMNCGPAIQPNLTARAQRAVSALRKPDPSLARVPNTVRQSIADVIVELTAGVDLWRERWQAADQAVEATIKDCERAMQEG